MVSQPSPSTPNGIFTNGKMSSISRSSPVGTTAVPASTPNKPAKPARRIDIEPIMRELTATLGDRWPLYRDTVTDFVIGKLNRWEFDETLQGILSGNVFKMHNQFVLSLLANALRDPPPPNNLEWSRRRKDHSRGSRGDVMAKRLKAEVMALPVRERRRLKAILREPTRKVATVPSVMLESRISKLPRIPIVKDNVMSKLFSLLLLIRLFTSCCVRISSSALLLVNESSR